MAVFTKHPRLKNVSVTKDGEPIISYENEPDDSELRKYLLQNSGLGKYLIKGHYLNKDNEFRPVRKVVILDPVNTKKYGGAMMPHDGQRQSGESSFLVESYRDLFDKIGGIYSELAEIKTVVSELAEILRSLEVSEDEPQEHGESQTAPVPDLKTMILQAVMSPEGKSQIQDLIKNPEFLQKMMSEGFKL